MVSFGLMTYRVCIFLEKHCLVRQLYAVCREGGEAKNHTTCA